ncbi:MAG: FecR family protein, partial [Bacteroides sp.]
MNKETLYKFFQNSATIQEEMQIREFYKERKIFDSILLLSDESSFSSDITNASLGKFKVRELIKIAAVAVITLVATFSFQYFTKSSEELALQTITVPAGQRINIELPDGTNVWLNSRSQIKYPTIFAADERKVILDGEAYFEVSHNKKKPF